MMFAELYEQGACTSLSLSRPSIAPSLELCCLELIELVDYFTNYWAVEG
jgi:hypothetical protein